jgi:hypothetical protein
MTMLLIALLYICYIDAITMVPPVYAMIIIWKLYCNQQQQKNPIFVVSEKAFSSEAYHETIPFKCFLMDCPVPIITNYPFNA